MKQATVSKSDLQLAFQTIEDADLKVSNARAKEVFSILLNAKPDKQVLHNLAYCYSDGYGTKKNYKKAIGLYKLAAKAGSIGAYFYLATMHERGNGVMKSLSKAHQYYLRGAEVGDVWSHVNAGWNYYNGVGTAKNIRKAEYHWKTAAQKKDASGLYSLGILYSSDSFDRKS